MPIAPASNRAALVLAVAAIVVTAGCGALGATSGTAEEPAPNTVTVEPGEFPDPPTSLTADRAAETAAYHHLALLYERLELERPSGETSVPSLDSVTTDAVERRDGGYYVAVSRSPSAAGDPSVPELSRAVYLVRENATPRPAFPIHTRGPADESGSGSSTAVDIRATNYASNGTSVTVVVTDLAGTPSTEYVTTLDVPAEEGVVVRDAVGSPGRYRVSVTTANASRSRTVTVADDGTTRPISLFLDPSGALEIYRGPVAESGP